MFKDNLQQLLYIIFITVNCENFKQTHTY